MTPSIQTTPTIQIKSAAEPPAVIAPDAGSVFATRARRFEQLADGHVLADWLKFLATLTRAQHAALQSLPALPLPDAAALARAREHRMPPLPAQSWPRDAAWHAVLRQLVETVTPAAPESARGDLARLAALPPADLEAPAERVLHTELYGADAALLPYVGAALQVLWTGAAAQLGASRGIAALDVPGVCPCCGFLPVASVVRNAGAGENTVANLRYLHCALCNTEWNLVRVKCAACDATEGIAYRELAGDAVKRPGAVRAETCDSCKSYLKVVYQEKGGVDPVADDLATLALDILVDEAGYARAGPNLLLVPGG
ncbi:formate dehydrogenase accessory protein FdhE [Sulfurisoma sediminicola]|uniref:Protein FdhE homolog n=1 Tax=Sulfurisoma sediminicola TaxID=1381557 RepID=A0A497XEJ8_9PROT|nr:formate dehydrogenase accessory protein FdhE [Sulfurisoma sediminicola]RLJ65383.1 Tat proofreading chaperone FdhE [Sulfurisoma sediminicola]